MYWQEWIIPAQAVYKSLITVLSSAFTWFTVWYFSRKPFPMFHGWMFTIMSLHVFSSVAVSSTKTAAGLLSNMLPELKSIISAPKQNAAKDSGTEAAERGSITDATATTGKTAARRLKQAVKVLFALMMLPFASGFFLLLHGGAVVADVEVIRRWRRWRSLRGTFGAAAAHQAMQEARHHSIEVSVLGHLIYGITCVPVKFSLVLMMADFTWIPVTSMCLSTFAGLSTLAAFCANPYTVRTTWARQHRAKGITLLVLALTGQFFCRFLECGWLVFKVAGPASNYYVYIGQLTSLVAFLLLGGPTGHKAFMRCYGSNKVAVTVLLALGSVVMVFDIPALFQGLQDRKTSRQPAWLMQLLFSPAMIALMAWRLAELFVACAIVLASHWLPPCNVRPSNLRLISEACSDMAWQKYVWLPRCWACSIFDMYRNLYPSMPLPAFLWATVLLAVAVACVGYIGTFLVLCTHNTGSTESCCKCCGGCTASCGSIIMVLKTCVQSVLACCGLCARKASMRSPPMAVKFDHASAATQPAVVVNSPTSSTPPALNSTTINHRTVAAAQAASSSYTSNCSTGAAQMIAPGVLNTAAAAVPTPTFITAYSTQAAQPLVAPDTQPVDDRATQLMTALSSRTTTPAAVSIQMARTDANTTTNSSSNGIVRVAAQPLLNSNIFVPKQPPRPPDESIYLAEDDFGSKSGVIDYNSYDGWAGCCGWRRSDCWPEATNYSSAADQHDGKAPADVTAKPKAAPTICGISVLLYIELAGSLLLLYGATTIVFNCHLYLKLGILSLALAYCLIKHATVAWRGFRRAGQQLVPQTQGESVYTGADITGTGTTPAAAGSAPA